MKLDRSMVEIKPAISPSEVLKLLGAYDAWGIPFTQQKLWFKSLGLYEQYYPALYAYENKRKQSELSRFIITVPRR